VVDDEGQVFKTNRASKMIAEDTHVLPAGAAEQRCADGFPFRTSEFRPLMRCAIFSILSMTD